MEKVLVEFPDDNVMVDLDSIVYIQALRDDQKARSQSPYNTYVNLRQGGPVYLTTAYEDVRNHLVDAVERIANA